MVNALEIRNLHATVEGKEILKGVTLTVRPGEIHALMGPNGTGKSTLANVLMGHPHYEVTSGEVLFKGQNLVELEPDERSRLGLFLAFQYPVAIPGVSVANFLRAAINARRKAGNPDDKGIPVPEFRRLLKDKMDLLKMPHDFAGHLAYQRATSQLVVERDQQVTYLSAARLKDELLKFSDVLVALARTPEIYRGEVGDQRAELRKASPRLAVFDSGVVLLDNFGVVRASEPERPEILRADWSDRDFFRELLATPGVFFSDATQDGLDGTGVVVISVPVLGENGEFVGALAGMFRLGEPRVSSFYASIVRQRLGQGGNTYLVDGNGQILYDSGYGRVGEVMDVGNVYGAGRQRAGALTGQGGAGRTRDAEGNDIVAAYAPVPGTGWTLVSEDDWAAVTSATRRYATILLILLVLGMVLPPLGMGLLVREKNAEMLERERTGQETRVANLIQQRLMPRQVPVLPGWSLAVHYQPATPARGNFHDFLLLADGCLMLALADVTETGLPAAHVIATTRATLRGAARSMLPPREALEYSNGLLCPEMDPQGRVSCLYGLLDPANGQFQLANAGFNMPLLSHNGDGSALRPPGTPLGVKLETRYDQDEVFIHPGEFILFYSDGLINTRNAHGEAFGPVRLASITAGQADDAQAVVETLLAEVREFTGSSAAYESDVTLVVLERTAEKGSAARSG